MALLTTRQEYNAIREAIQGLTGTGNQTVSVQIGELSVSYNASQIVQLQAREAELARRLTTRNLRKRVTPDFSC